MWCGKMYEGKFISVGVDILDFYKMEIHIVIWTLSKVLIWYKSNICGKKILNPLTEFAKVPNRIFS